MVSPYSDSFCPADFNSNMHVISTLCLAMKLRLKGICLISDYLYLNIHLTQCINRQIPGIVNSWKAWSSEKCIPNFFYAFSVGKIRLQRANKNWCWILSLFFSQILFPDMAPFIFKFAQWIAILTHYCLSCWGPYYSLTSKSYYLLFNGFPNHGDRICQTDLCLDTYLKSELFSQANMPV